MRLVVVADTHIRSQSSRTLPPKLYELLDGADAIAHAGDIVSQGVLDDLSRFATVHAVLGNNDHELTGLLPETLELELEGVPIGMVHDSGQAKGREQRMHKRFPDADLVIFGHSHIPWDTVGVNGQLLFNPGSPTERRRQPHPTAGYIDLRGGTVTRRRIVNVTPA